MAQNHALTELDDLVVKLAKNCGSVETALLRHEPNSILMPFEESL
jgi:hypothetical protein